MAIRSAPLGALAALALGACVTATVPAAAQGANIAGSWPSGQAAARNTGGSAPGALAGSAFAPNNFRSCHWQNWPLYDVEGNFAGYQPVQVCN
jgi:hypothetical protein